MSVDESMHPHLMARIVPALVLLATSLSAQTLPRSEWGAPDVSVSHAGGKWLIAGKKNQVTIDEKNFAMTVQNGSATWVMAPSGSNDMIVKADKKEFPVRLADAKYVEIKPYDTGFKTGVKMLVSDWVYRDRNETLSIDLHLTVALEGPDEELVCDVAAQEHGPAVIRQLDWPTALDARDVDYTLLPNGRGNLLPRDWPEEYF